MASAKRTRFTPYKNFNRVLSFLFEIGTNVFFNSVFYKVLSLPT